MGDSQKTSGTVGRWSTLPAFMFLVLLATAACAADQHAMAAPTASHDAHVVAAGSVSLPVADSSEAATSAAPVDAGQIRIENFQFSPATLTVPAGSTVTWTNEDGEEHTVTSSTRAFSSSGLDTRETYSHRFDTPGTYAYFCALHPHMTAQIIVQ